MKSALAQTGLLIALLILLAVANDSEYADGDFEYEEGDFKYEEGDFDYADEHADYEAGDFEYEEGHADYDEGGSDYGEGEMPMTGEIYHKIGRVNELVEFDVKMIDAEISSRNESDEDLIELWYQFDSMYPYPEDIYSLKAARRFGTFTMSAKKLIVKEKVSMKKLFFDCIATIVKQRNPQETPPPLSYTSKLAFQQLIAAVDVLDNLVANLHSEHAEDEIEFGDLEQELLMKLESLLMLAGIGVGSEGEIDEYDEPTIDYENLEGLDGYDDDYGSWDDYEDEDKEEL